MPKTLLRPIHAVVLLIAGVALVATACSSPTSPSGSGSNSPSSTTSSSSSTSSSPTATPTTTGPPAKKVQVMLLNADGSEFGVGMPEIAYFSRKITNAAALQKATTVTVNGQTEHGAWYFEYSDAHKGYPIEGHFRLQSFWPANSKIFINMPIEGLSAGTGMVYGDSLTSSWTTGNYNKAIVDNYAHTLTLYVNNKKEGVYPVSLGAAKTPTYRGIKVIMEQQKSICMTDTLHTYYECGIKYTQRLTYSGEYLHSAPWNCLGSPGCTGPLNNIGHGNSSNGCTNLTPTDAAKLYNILRIGDVVEYPNADGPQMPLGNGYGDWNVSWSQWLTGGLVPTDATTA